MSKNLFDEYKRILALAQAGLFYGKDPFDHERYQEIQQIALKLLSHLSNEPLEKLRQIVDQEEGYPTPKVDVRAYIKKQDKILLVEDAKTKEWSLPGGYAEIGLSPKENIVKEVFEETGLQVSVDQLIAVFDTHLRKDIPQLFQYYKLIFSCTVLEGSFQHNLETSSIGWFARNNLPVFSEKRTTYEQLAILEKRNLPYSD